MATHQFISGSTEVLSATGDNSAMLILIIAGALILIGLLVFVLSTLGKRKRAKAAEVPSESAPSDAAGSAPTDPAPNTGSGTGSSNESENPPSTP